MSESDKQFEKRNAKETKRLQKMARTMSKHPVKATDVMSALGIEVHHM